MNTAKQKLVYVGYDKGDIDKVRRILDENMIAYRLQEFNPNSDFMRPFENENIYYEIRVGEKDYIAAQYLLKNI